MKSMSGKSLSAYHLRSELEKLQEIADELIEKQADQAVRLKKPSLSPLPSPDSFHPGKSTIEKLKEIVDQLEKQADQAVRFKKPSLSPLPSPDFGKINFPTFEISFSSSVKIILLCVFERWALVE